MATQETSAAASSELDRRIERMFAYDRLTGALLVIFLWLTVFFVMLSVRQYIENPAVEVVCWIAAAILLLFNSMSIIAMFRHYAADKEHIYSVDIRHLDAGR